MGIQWFAQEKFEEALKAFEESKTILTHHYGSKHPRLSMVINNIASCQFLMHDIDGALTTMKEAMELQRVRNANNDHASSKSDLDLLYMAILLNNHGYLLVNTKQYEDAQSTFEEALLASYCPIEYCFVTLFVIWILFSNLSLLFVPQNHLAIPTTIDPRIGTWKCIWSSSDS